MNAALTPSRQFHPLVWLGFGALSTAVIFAASVAALTSFFHLRVVTGDAHERAQYESQIQWLQTQLVTAQHQQVAQSTAQPFASQQRTVTEAQLRDLQKAHLHQLALAYVEAHALADWSYSSQPRLLLVADADTRRSRAALVTALDRFAILKQGCTELEAKAVDAHQWHFSQDNAKCQIELETLAKDIAELR